MSNMKKIIVSLPESLLVKIDDQSKLEGKNRSVVIREALALYLAERKKAEIEKCMREGYLAMGQLNLQLSEEGLGIDLQSLTAYEKILKHERKSE
ncbi:MAG: CopG family ribbon-helix-helix protein [Anaerovoracaceae bacterium]|jgi:CopG family transcriptional regulator/antitoxin EndoAI